MQDRHESEEVIQKSSYLGLRLLEYINELAFPTHGQYFLVFFRDCGEKIGFEVFGELPEWCWGFGDEFD